MLVIWNIIIDLNTTFVHVERFSWKSGSGVNPSFKYNICTCRAS